MTGTSMPAGCPCHDPRTFSHVQPDCPQTSVPRWVAGQRDRIRRSALVSMSARRAAAGSAVLAAALLLAACGPVAAGQPEPHWNLSPAPAAVTR